MVSIGRKKWREKLDKDKKFSALMEKIEDDLLIIKIWPPLQLRGN